MDDMTRVDMLLELIKKNNSYSEEIFDLLIPTYYSECYSLYNILKRASILDKCKFKNPEVFNDELTFPISLPGKASKKIMEYLETKKFRVKYLESDDFKVTIVETSSGIKVKFTKVEEE
jgi:hypothetical protein